MFNSLCFVSCNIISAFLPNQVPAAQTDGKTLITSPGFDMKTTHVLDANRKSCRRQIWSATSPSDQNYLRSSFFRCKIVENSLMVWVGLKKCRYNNYGKLVSCDWLVTSDFVRPAIKRSNQLPVLKKIFKTCESSQRRNVSNGKIILTRWWTFVGWHRLKPTITSMPGFLKGLLPLTFRYLCACVGIKNSGSVRAGPRPQMFSLKIC